MSLVKRRRVERQLVGDPIDKPWAEGVANCRGKIWWGTRSGLGVALVLIPTGTAGRERLTLRTDVAMTFLLPLAHVCEICNRMIQSDHT